MATFVFIFLWSLPAVVAAALLPTPTPGPGQWASTWISDGTVHVLASDGNKVFMGGDFGAVAPNHSFLTSLVPDDMNITAGPWVGQDTSASIEAIVPDGAGGYYVGGRFTELGGVSVSRCAHVLADGTVNPGFAPNPDNVVHSLVLAGSILYAGGYFESIGGRSRFGVAALNATTGQALAEPSIMVWPGYQGGVHSMVKLGDTLYLGGTFEFVTPLARSRFAAIDIPGGQVLPLNLTVSGSVHSMALLGSTLYLGGEFSAVNGSVRHNAASIDTASGALLPWNPGSSQQAVHAIAVTESAVYLGSLGVTSVTTDTADIMPGPALILSERVYALALAGQTLLVGGAFEQVQGQERPALLGLDVATGTLNSEVPQTFKSSGIRCLVPDGERILIGGWYQGLGAVPRKNLAAVDAVSGALLPWRCDADGLVSALAVSASANRLYVGGEFDLISGSSKPHLAAATLSDGALVIEFSPPTPDGRISSFQLDEGSLYIGGSFTGLGGLPPGNLAKLDSQGARLSFDISVLGEVKALALAGSKLYLGGSFATVESQLRVGFAAIDISGPNPTLSEEYYYLNGETRSLVRAGDFVYLGGSFSNPSAYGLHRIWAVTPYRELATFGLNSSADVRGVVHYDGNLYAVGVNLNSTWGVPLEEVAVFDYGTDQPMEGAPSMIQAEVYAAVGAGGLIHLGGRFKGLNGRPQLNYGAFVPLLAHTPTPTLTSTPTISPTSSVSPSPTITPTISETVTPCPTTTRTSSTTAIPTPTASPTPNATMTAIALSYTSTALIRRSNLNASIVAPMPVRRGQEWCLYFQESPVSAELEIFNSAGERVKKLALGGGAQACWVADFAPGIYWIHLKIQSAGTTEIRIQKAAVLP
jgi:hypothetical protein